MSELSMEKAKEVLPKFKMFVLDSISTEAQEGSDRWMYIHHMVRDPYILQIGFEEKMRICLQPLSEKQVRYIFNETYNFLDEKGFIVNLKFNSTNRKKVYYLEVCWEDK